MPAAHHFDRTAATSGSRTHLARSYALTFSLSRPHNASSSACRTRLSVTITHRQTHTSSGDALVVALWRLPPCHASRVPPACGRPLRLLTVSGGTFSPRRGLTRSSCRRWKSILQTHDVQRYADDTPRHTQWGIYGDIMFVSLAEGDSAAGLQPDREKGGRNGICGEATAPPVGCTSHSASAIGLK